MNLKNIVSLVPQVIKFYLESEITEDGLLSDVETLIPNTYSEVPVDAPAVWIVQHPTTLWDKGKNNNLSHIVYLQTPFEFVCVDYSDDLEEAAIMGLDLAARVGASIQKNFNKIKIDESLPGRFFLKLELQSIYPVGEVQIEGKSNRIPATSIIFNFVYIIDWLKCRKE